MTNSTATTNREAVAEELGRLEEEQRNEVADLERQAVELERQVVDAQAVLAKATKEAWAARRASQQVRWRFDTVRSRLQGVLRSSAPAAIAAFREASMARLDDLSTSRNTDLGVRQRQAEAIRAALRELPGLELQVDEAVVEERLRELDAEIEHAGQVGAMDSALEENA